MKVPGWFVLGCGLLVLNVILVLGGTLSRHASGKGPDDSNSSNNSQSRADATPADEPPTLPSSSPATVASDSFDTPLPLVPSLETRTTSSSVVHMDDFKPYLSPVPSTSDILAPLDQILKDSTVPVPEQLSHSFFEAMKLRLKTTEHLNHSAIGLVEEAATLYQRGDVKKSQELLGIATQLREMTARLLVTCQ